jgi:hypothetical protein
MTHAINDAITTSLVVIDGRPGEFTTEDVLVLTYRVLMKPWDPEKFLAPAWRKKGLGRFLDGAIRNRIRARLRYAKDPQFGWRKYLCYEVDDKAGRQWLKTENLTEPTADAVSRSREGLLGQIAALGPVLDLAREKLRGCGTEVRFAVFQQEIWDALHPADLDATGTDG